ncbi:Hypothetical_protein [Hexamita inflata]|uniref:Hypothetical_protein n=1 Tax=Hexamita inflata TaxID=28002 RepID=A0AA86RQI7_9EUKA|nr:Hypothetical protein HINF_LOCUS63922 [Hexamita inflata]
MNKQFKIPHVLSQISIYVEQQTASQTTMNSMCDQKVEDFEESNSSQDFKQVDSNIKLLSSLRISIKESKSQIKQIKQLNKVCDSNCDNIQRLARNIKKFQKICK